MKIRKSLIYGSMSQLYILLLALFWSAFNLSDAWEPDGHITAVPWQSSVSESHPPLIDTESLFLPDMEYEDFFYSLHDDLESSDLFEDVPEPNITVYRLMEDRDHVIVLCKSAEMSAHRRQSFELSVESELNYTIEPLEFSPFSSSEMHVFLVTVSPPASFTCVQTDFNPGLDFDLAVRNLRSQTYNYSGSVLDHHNHHEEGVSSLYICFSSFIAVGLFIMTAAVIVTNIRSKTEDTNSTAVTDNDYVEA